MSQKSILLSSTTRPFAQEWKVGKGKEELGVNVASAGNTAHDKALKIQYSQASIIKARLTSSRTSDPI